jgi:hypothetical protein
MKRHSLVNLLATEFITVQAKMGEPFFLYFPLTAPHKPVLPHPRFQEKTELGPDGDFVAQVDATVARVCFAAQHDVAASSARLAAASRERFPPADHTASASGIATPSAARPA